MLHAAVVVDALADGIVSAKGRLGLNLILLEAQAPAAREFRGLSRWRWFPCGWVGDGGRRGGDRGRRHGCCTNGANARCGFPRSRVSLGRRAGCRARCATSSGHVHSRLLSRGDGHLGSACRTLSTASTAWVTTREAGACWAHGRPRRAVPPSSASTTCGVP